MIEPYNHPHQHAVSLRWRGGLLLSLSINILGFLAWSLGTPSDAPISLYRKRFKVRICSNDSDHDRGSIAAANPAIKYSKQRIWRPLHNNSFTGEPRIEHDAAWRDLLKPMVIKVSQEDIERLGTESIAFKDGSGYMAEMAVFHELHCLKRLKQHIWLDYYHPNMSAAETEIEETHIDHCIEYLRRAAICRGDTSLVTFFWEDGKPKTRNWSDHICVDWQTLRDFAVMNSVLIEDYSNLIGP